MGASYILILTLAFSGGNGKSSLGGLGGVAMGEFASEKSCDVAKQRWLKEVGSQLRTLQTAFSKDGKNNVKIAFCSPK